MFGLPARSAFETVKNYGEMTSYFLGGSFVYYQLGMNFSPSQPDYPLGSFDSSGEPVTFGLYEFSLNKFVGLIVDAPYCGDPV